MLTFARAHGGRERERESLVVRMVFKSLSVSVESESSKQKLEARLIRVAWGSGGSQWWWPPVEEDAVAGAGLVRSPELSLPLSLYLDNTGAGFCWRNLV